MGVASLACLVCRSTVEQDIRRVTRGGAKSGKGPCTCEHRKWIIIVITAVDSNWSAVSLQCSCCLGALGYTKYSGKRCSAPYYPRVHVLIIVRANDRNNVNPRIPRLCYLKMTGPFTRSFHHPDFSSTLSAYSAWLSFTIHWEGMGTRLESHGSYANLI